LGGRAKHNIENALCATGLAYGMGVAPKVIAKALRELDTTAELIPGRLNRISGLPYELIVDAAHNAHGMRALAKFVESIPRSGGRRIFALVARESDSEEALDAMVNEAAEVFDIFVCRDVSKLYRLEPGQCANALAAALRRTGVEEDRIKVIPERLEAMRYALDIAKPSDLVVIELAHLVVLRDLIDEIETRKRELRSAG
jgi:cyanophycin synthetase